VARIKLYTVDEAERTLPLVRRIVRDIQENFAEHEKRLLERKKHPLNPRAGGMQEETVFRLEREMEHYEAEVARFQRELEAMGIELKDYRNGLLDFFSRYDNRIVYLCWKSDEGDRLAFWHDLNAGFKGRQRITALNRHRFQGLPPGKKFVDFSLGQG
jgi:hypothetical protein